MGYAQDHVVVVGMGVIRPGQWFAQGPLTADFDGALGYAL